MAISNFIPEIWSQNLNLAFRKSFVFRNLTNADYEGEIRRFGDTVHINRPNALTVNPYSGSVTYETPTSAQTSLVIDQAEYWAYAIDDVDKVQANVDLLRTYTDEGGIALADAVDQYVASLYTDVHADNIITKAAYDEDTIYAAYVEAQKRLNLKSVPAGGRWATIDPATYSLIVKAPEFIKASDLGDAVVQTGAVGMIAGFNLFLTNNAPTATDGTHDVTHLLYGTRAGITFAAQLLNMEALRLEEQFADGVRALFVFGAKAVKPEAIGDLRIQVGVTST